MNRVASGLLTTTLAVLLLASGAAVKADFFQDNPDWKESEVPPPPPFDFNKLVTFSLENSTALVYGVDPATIRISNSDSVVRYVMVATSQSGVRNVMYEGIQCDKAEVKTYARYTPPGQWHSVRDPQWFSLFEKKPSMHSLAFARLGACDGKSPATSVHEIVTKLNSNPQYKGFN